MKIKTTHPTSQGFTAVELLVTLVVGALFVIAGYQLFMIVTADSSSSRNRSLASNIASAELNRQISASMACSVGEPTELTDLPTPADTPLIDPEVTGQVSWPYGCSGSTVTKRVEIVVTYGDPGSREEVRHARLAEN